MHRHAHRESSSRDRWTPSLELTPAGLFSPPPPRLSCRPVSCPVRKKGKLPYKTYEQTYDLEYGTNTVAIHIDAIKPGSRVILIDDLLATGGTAAAAAALLQKVGANILEVNFFIELSFLSGREKLAGLPGSLVGRLLTRFDRPEERQTAWLTPEDPRGGPVAAKIWPERDI